MFILQLLIGILTGLTHNKFCLAHMQKNDSTLVSKVYFARAGLCMVQNHINHNKASCGTIAITDPH